MSCVTTTKILSGQKQNRTYANFVEVALNITGKIKEVYILKLLDKFTKKFAKSTSTAVKTEVKKTAVDLLPTVVGVVSMVVGIVIFKGTTGSAKIKPIKPSVTNTHVTTNNYFFQNLSEDMIKKIMEGK